MRGASNIAFRLRSTHRFVLQQETFNMTSIDVDRWTRVKDRLRAEVGDDVYSSWFARMELDGSEGDTVKLSVPTRFLKSWIQSHYAERVLACWQAEQPNYSRVELTVRSAVIRCATRHFRSAPCTLRSAALRSIRA